MLHTGRERWYMLSGVVMKDYVHWCNCIMQSRQFNLHPRLCLCSSTAPSAPSFIHFSELTTTSVNMSWGEPKQPNGIIEGYRLVYEPCTPVDGEKLLTIYWGRLKKALIYTRLPLLPFKLPNLWNLLSKLVQAVSLPYEGKTCNSWHTSATFHAL